MQYYKLINDSTFIGVGSSADMRCYQKKHRILLGCDEQSAQYIQIDNTLYRADWMIPADETTISFKQAKIIEIDKNEYNALKKASENGENIEVTKPEPIVPEEPKPDPSDEITFEYIRSKKIAEMSHLCNLTITNGFDAILEDKQSHHFSLTTQDQLNLITLQSMILSGQTSVPYHADNEPCRFFSTADIQTVLTGATKHITYHESYFNSLKAYINSLDKIETVGGIEYGVDIPDDYQTEVLRTLLSQKG